MATKTVRIILLGLWAGFFAWIVSLGQKDLARLLHPDLWWLVICATGILLLFLAVNCRRLVVGRQETSILWQWPGLATLLVPLLFFFQVQDARFNADTFSKRSIPTAEGFRQGDINLKDLGDESASTDIPLTRLVFASNTYIGKDVEVVCQTLVNDRLPEGIAMCYRYLMNCCAADAMPVFIFIKPLQETAIENDTWIRAKGILSMRKNSDIEVPMISADSVEYVEEPAFPYVF